MATKVGEAYVEIYPRINRALRARVIAGIARDMRKVYNDASKDETQMAHRTVNQTTRTRRIGEENNRSQIRETGRVLGRFWRTQRAESKKTEGSFHALATKFRTIGTVGRGLLISTAVLSSWRFLQFTVGAVAAAMPLVTASLVATPALLAGTAIEAGILYQTVGKVGQTLKDAFDPARQKQFNEEFDSLAPSAKKFVTEIKNLHGLKLPSIQQAFFSSPNVQGFAKGLPHAAKSLAPAAAHLAFANGQLLGAQGQALTGTAGIKSFNALMLTMSHLLLNTTSGLKRLTIGFLDLIRHTAEFLGPKAGGGVNKWLTDVGRKMSHLNVAKVFHKASSAGKGFKTVGDDIWTILKGIYRVLGGNNLAPAFFSTGGLGGILDVIAKFVKSGKGKKFLDQLGAALTQVSRMASSLAGSALRLLAGAFAALYPQIKPFADIVTKLGKDLIPLGPVIGAVLAAALSILTGILKTIEPWLRRVVGYLTQNPDKVKKYAGVILKVAGAYLLLKKATGKLGFDLTTVVKGLVSIGPVGLIVVGIIILLAGAIIYTYKHSKTFRDLVHQLGKKLGELWKVISPVIIPTLKVLAKIIGYVLIGAIFILIKWISFWIGVFKKIATIVRDVRKVLERLGPFLTKTVPAFFKKMAHNIAAEFDHVRNNVHRWWSNVANFFSGNVKGFFVKTIPGWFGSFRHNVGAWFSHQLRDIKNWWHSVFVFMTKSVPGFFTKTVPGWARSLRYKVGSWFAHQLQDVKNWWKAVHHFFWSTVPSFFTKTIPGWFSTFRHKVAGVFGGLVTSISKVWGKLGELVKKPVEFLVNVVYDKGIVPFWNATVGKLPGIKSLKPVHFFAQSRPTVQVFHGLKRGGPVYGPGGPTDDLIDAMGPNRSRYRLSNGEYVVNAASTRKHRPLIEAINNDNIRGLAQGGVVGALNFLKGVAGKIPYVFGAVGPRAYDCSGLVGEVWARLTGHPSYRRYFTTANEGAFAKAHGFQKGAQPGGFTIGWGGDHTTGILAGHRFEAAHSGTKMRLDDGATSALSFPNVWHLGGVAAALIDPLINKIHKEGATKYFAKAYSLIKKTPSEGAGVYNIGKGHGYNVTNRAVSAINAATKKAYEAALSAVTFGGSNLGNLGSGAMAKFISKASKYVNIPKSWIPGLYYIARHESGINPHAYNSTPVGRWHAKGLMQMLWPTFSANHAPGTSWNIYDGIANLAASVNYIRSRYGSPSGTPWLTGSGNYYRDGGLVKQYDTGGVVFPGYTSVYNGTGSNEYMFTQKQMDEFAQHCNVTVILDGVDVTSRAHVEVSNQSLIRALNKRGGHRP